MAAVRQIFFRPIGLVTQPNKIGTFPPGAMGQARDVIMRAPNTIQQAYIKNAAWATLTSGYRIRLLYSTANQVLVVRRDGNPSTAIDWINPTLVTPTVTAAVVPVGYGSAFDPFSTTGRLMAITMRGRTLVNGSTKDDLVADFENPTTTAERTFRQPGIAQPTLQVAGTSSASPQAVKNNTAVTYAAIIKRTYADGYIIKSRPSSFEAYFNATGATIDPQLRVSFNGFNDPKVDDVIELYRSQGITYAGSYIDPGSTLYKVASRALTSTDITNGSYVFTDQALASNTGDPLAGLGEPLYTNPGFGGIAATVNDPPPPAACMAAFRGRSWHSNYKLPGRISLAIRRQFGRLTSATERATGIGERLINGTSSNGSPTITGISAADMVGLVVGQLVSGTGLAGSPKIITVGATTITLAANAGVGAGAGVFLAQDVLEIDALTINVSNIGFQILNGYRISSTKSLFGSTGIATLGIELGIRKERYIAPATLTLRATHGDFYDPQLPEISATVMTIQPTQAKNGVVRSLPQQPEACPPFFEIQVGTGEIYATIPTRDALWFFCSDGLYRLSGTINPVEGIPDIRVDPIDTTLILAGPRAWCVVRDQIFAYTNRGLIAIGEDTITEVSTGVVGDLLPGAFWAESEVPFLVADERVDEIYIMGAHATLNFVYSLRYNCFTTTSQFDAAQNGVQVASTLSMLFAYSANVIDQLQPDLTALVASATADFQPVFGDRPDSQKQFIDVIYVWDLASNNVVQARFNQAAISIGDAAFMQSVAGSQDRRSWVGVPRNAPAIAPSIAIGYNVTQNGRMALSAVSVAFTPFTQQGGMR